MVTLEGLFDRVLQYPDPDAQRRLAGLVGIDGIRADLIREAKTLLDPSVLERWSTTHYKAVLPVVEEVGGRTPLVVLAGDVGTGKTELAESFPDAVARDLGIEMTLYPLSLSARGRGAVGEMTTLLTAAFEAVTDAARGGRVNGKVRSGVVLLVDEADALAQSRDLDQMHHEDRAGVNALIRGIDTLRTRRLPVLTVMSTNREEALDPAVVRRATRIFRFARPDEDQRQELFARQLEGAKVNGTELDQLVKLSGPLDGRSYGWTFSDIRQRFIVQAVLDSLDRGPLQGDRLVVLAAEFVPTPPFGQTDG